VRLVRIGPYEVLGELGRGGMGVVYKVRTPDGREAALKLVKTDQATFARFERERRLLAALGENEGFVGLLDAGTSAEGAWLVMPFVPGGTLRQRLERGPLGVSETVAVGTDLARALGAAHQKGIVHRDVKPENVLFTSSGRPLLADLGLAKHFDSLAAGGSKSVILTERGAFKGTAGYLAPEQIADAATAGPPADVFALGAVLHECLSGKPAFSGATVLEVLAKLGSGTVEPLRDVPPWLEEIVRRALALDPRARFLDGGALAEALSGAGASQGKVARPGRRRGALVPIAAGATLGGLVLAVLTVALGLTAQRRVEKPVPDNLPATLRTKPAATSPKASEPSPSGTELRELPVERLSKAELERALASTTREIELHPTLPMAWVNRGAVRVRRGDADGAISDTTKAIELDPDLPLAWTIRGTARGLKFDWDGMIADENEAIALDSNLPRAWADRGFARGNRGDCDGEIADETRAIELDPNLALAWDNRGAARSRKRDWDGVVADATRAIELAPNVATAWVNRGVARGNKGDVEGAIADETRAIELDPRLAMAWVNRATARSRKGDLDGEINDETRAIALAPNDVVAWANRGNARGKKGDWDGEIADESKALELDPNRAVGWAFRGEARGQKGDWDGLISDETRALQLDPNSVFALVKRGIAWINRGDWDRAIADDTRAIELAPEIAAAWSSRGAARGNKGDIQGAIADLERALVLDPDGSDAARVRANLATLRNLAR
jgi:tetratricopeptide (TPR) repeat protein/tRNA A-37 threonylcarbamoyl transferase component Bud32